ncbi:MAG: phosphoenolpyruvate carboxylase, partial [Gammaproteobacteria bacterium]
MNTAYDEKELRRGIRLLDSMLGEVLEKEADPRVAATVRELQRDFTHLHRHDMAARMQHLFQVIEPLQPEMLSAVVRAFNLYFSLVNIAEESYGLALRRRRAEQGGHFWKGSFHDTLLTLKESGVEARQLKTLLDELLYMPVMTAHPTEAKRRIVKTALRNIFLTHEKLEDSRLKGHLREEMLARLHSQIQLLWKTDEVRARSMGVEDEIDAGLSYFSLSLFEATIQVYRNFDRALHDVYGEEARQIGVPSFLTYGSWIGGDRDGNPNVKPETTVRALRLQARTILQEYLYRLDILRDQLSHSYGLCEPSAEFLASLEHDRLALGTSVSALEKPFVQEPYRHKLVLIRYRLEQALAQVERRLDGNSGQTDRWDYSCDAFLTDLRLIRDSLCRHGDAEIAGLELQDLLRLAKTFGFHLMQLDVRQESTRHSEAVAEILASALSIDYRSLAEAERLAVLSEAIAVPGGLVFDRERLSEASRDTLEVFAVMAGMRAELGSDCFSRYVISMTHAASHVMEVMVLAAQSGLAG